MRYRTAVISVVLGFSVLGLARADVLDSEDFEAFANVPFEIAGADDWTVAADNEAVVNVIEANLSYQRGPISVSGGNRALEIGPGMPSATTNNYVDWSFAEVLRLNSSLATVSRPQAHWLQGLRVAAIV